MADPLNILAKSLNKNQQKKENKSKNEVIPKVNSHAQPKKNLFGDLLKKRKGIFMK